VKGDPYSIIWLTLGRIETETIIDYPKLPEIMAQFCSVLQSFMIFGLLFSYVNNKILKKRLLSEMNNFLFHDSEMENNHYDYKKIIYDKSIRKMMF